MQSVISQVQVYLINLQTWFFPILSKTKSRMNKFYFILFSSFSIRNHVVLAFYVFYDRIMYIYDEFSLGFRARDNSSLELAIVMHSKDCIYTYKYVFIRFKE